MYLRVFLTLFSGFVHFYLDYIVFWSLKPALRAFRGFLEDAVKEGAPLPMPKGKEQARSPMEHFEAAVKFFPEMLLRQLSQWHNRDIYLSAPNLVFALDQNYSTRAVEGKENVSTVF